MDILYIVSQTFIHVFPSLLVTIIVVRLARLYSEHRDFDNVMTLLKNSGLFFSQIPKAKTAKIVRSILDIVSKTPDSLDVQVSLCVDVVEWCVAEKRTFLRHRIESKVSLESHCYCVLRYIAHICGGHRIMNRIVIVFVYVFVMISWQVCIWKRRWDPKQWQS